MQVRFGFAILISKQHLILNCILNPNMKQARPRFLILCFDALRPDMVSEETMPNLHRFAREGVRCKRHRAVFPSETRVNQSSLVTGCYPQKHGIVGNKFFDPVASPGKLFNTGDENQLMEGDRRLGGKLVDVPVLGELLAEHDLSLATLSSGTPGGARMLNHKAESLGTFRFALHRPDASVPRNAVAEMQEKLGPVPEHQIPSLEWLTYSTNAYLNYIEPVLSPDVCILWFCEPDNSYHFRGLGSPENLQALSRADQEFGRILDWQHSQNEESPLQIITFSDHGQLTVCGETINLQECLQEAGFTVGEPPGKDVDAAVAVDSAGGIYVRDSDPILIGRIVEWLQQQPWCGPVLTRNGEKSLKLEMAGLDHPRAPDIALVLKSNDLENEYGIRGGCMNNSSFYPVGGGLHGGLNALELQSWMAARGSCFQNKSQSKLSSGIIDILPTILHLLGVPVPEHVQGRVLHEIISESSECSIPEMKRVTHEAQGAGDYQAKLEVTELGDHFYLEQGWVEQGLK